MKRLRLLRLELVFVHIKPQCHDISDTEILCSGENLSAVPDWLSRNITILGLSENNISSLDATTLVQYPQIEVLHLDYNAFTTSIELQSISVLQNLKHLDVSNNHFLLTLDLTDFISNKRLETIIANNNPHVDITGSNAVLPNLKYISLQRCALNEFPLEEFAGCTGLEVLDIRYNNLTNLPKNILQVLPNLKELYITGNPIQNLDTSLCELIANEHPNCTIPATTTDIPTEGPQANPSTSVRPMPTQSTRALFDDITSSDMMTTDTSSIENSKSSWILLIVIPILVLVGVTSIAYFRVQRFRQCISNQIIRLRRYRNREAADEMDEELKHLGQGQTDNK